MRKGQERERERERERGGGEGGGVGWNLPYIKPNGHKNQSPGTTPVRLVTIYTVQWGYEQHR